MQALTTAFDAGPIQAWSCAARQGYRPMWLEAAFWDEKACGRQVSCRRSLGQLPGSTPPINTVWTRTASALHPSTDWDKTGVAQCL